MKVFTDDPELGRETKSDAAFVHEVILVGLEERISSWPRLKRIIDLVLCFKMKLFNCIRRNRSAKELDHTKQHSVLSDLEGIKMAENEMIRSAQWGHIGKELITLGKGKRLKSWRSIVNLDPFINDEGILKVVRRTQRLALANEMQHPALLTKSCRIAELLVRWYRGQVAHAGGGMTVNQIRFSDFWVTRRCNSLVRWIILKYFRCKQLRERVQQQKMAGFCNKRMNEAPPFMYCEVELLGSFIVKDDRKSSRAIHTQFVYSLSTESFTIFHIKTNQY